MTYKAFGGFDTIVKEFNLKKRAELDPLFATMREEFKDNIAGPAFCKINYISSVTEGYWVEAGFPVSNGTAVPAGYKSRHYPEYSVIAIEADRGLKNLGEKYKKVYDHAYNIGMISEEFVVEVYPEETAGGRIELLFVEHKWPELFIKNSLPFLDPDDMDILKQQASGLGLETSMPERFARIKKMVEGLDRRDEHVKYKVTSGCSHVFPKEQLEKLRRAYVAARNKNADPIDAVIEFMKGDRGWGEAAVRDGNTIYSEKKPRDPKAFAEAQSDKERKKAYCFCPIIRENLDKGMSKSYCYCGAGWYRQQWEYATGKEVRVEILTSILNGDDKCSFKVILPD
jgi:hypothetical protein